MIVMGLVTDDAWKKAVRLYIRGVYTASELGDIAIKYLDSAETKEESFIRACVVDTVFSEKVLTLA